MQPTAYIGRYAASPHKWFLVIATSSEEALGLAEQEYGPVDPESITSLLAGTLVNFRAHADPELVTRAIPAEIDLSPGAAEHVRQTIEAQGQVSGEVYERTELASATPYDDDILLNLDDFSILTDREGAMNLLETLAETLQAEVSPEAEAAPAE